MLLPERRRSIFTLLLLIALPAGAAAQGGFAGPGAERNMLRFSLGYFVPRGDSTYWLDKELDFTGSSSDFEDLSVGFEYLRRLNSWISLVGSSSFYEGSATQAYRDYVDTSNLPIRHEATLTIVSFNLGVLVNLAPESSPVIPYLGAGAGAYLWELAEEGEFVDFSTADIEIFEDLLVSESETFGYYWLAGLSVPLGSTWSVFGEARWQRAEDELGDDFIGFGTLDLSGREFRIGVAWLF